MNDLADRLPRTLVSASEPELVQEFEQRLRDSGTLAFRVAYSVLRHREDAEDVAQDAIAKAFRSFPRLRDRNRFRAWLVRATWRMALDHRRESRRRSTREQSAVELVCASTEDTAAELERAAHLWTAIDSLPDRLRLTVVLASIEGHDTPEVALLLRIPEGTVRSRLFLARKALAEKLQWLTRNR